MGYGFVLRVVWCNDEQFIGRYLETTVNENIVEFTNDPAKAHIFCEEGDPSLDYKNACDALENIEASAENNILLTPCMINIKVKKNFLDFTENW